VLLSGFCHGTVLNLEEGCAETHDFFHFLLGFFNVATHVP
jgi:hypothetical protein